MAQLKERAALLEPDKLPVLRPFAGAVYIIDEKPHSIEPAAAVEAPGEVILDESFNCELDRAWTPVVSPRAKEAGRLDATATYGKFQPTCIPFWSVPYPAIPEE